MTAYDQTARRILFAAVLVALASASGALAARGDPQKRITPADQARAKAMLVRRSDLGSGFRLSLQSPLQGAYCAADDESDLVVTGEARSGFSQRPVAVQSGAEIYRTVADADASWRRSTSRGGRRCLLTEFRRELTSVGVRSVRSPPPYIFPRVAQRVFAFRVTGLAQGIPVVFDLVALQQSRAQVVLLFGSAPRPLGKAEELRLVGLVASRMARAMRGA